MRTLSIVIPTLNEEEGISQTISLVLLDKLKEMGFDTEIIVVDNGSTDQTAAKATLAGAKVIKEPQRGYGWAYRTGLKKAQGKIIATGDADSSYPFSDLPRLLGI